MKHNKTIELTQISFDKKIWVDARDIHLYRSDAPFKDWIASKIHWYHFNEEFDYLPVDYDENSVLCRGKGTEYLLSLKAAQLLLAEIETATQSHAPERVFINPYHI
jgi:phage anti-repressor protein